MYDELLKRLDEAGSTGVDLSPGDLLAKEAATAIRILIDEIDWWANWCKEDA